MAEQRELPHEINRQDNSYFCGPAAVRVALTTRGIYVSEQELAGKLGTTPAGTNSSTDIDRVMDAYIRPGVEDFAPVFVRGNDVTAHEAAAFRANVVKSIDAGYGVVVNVVGTGEDVHGNRYTYSGGHYVAVCGYRQSGAQMLVTDVAIGRDYWMATDALDTWMAARGYVWAAHVPAAPLPWGPAAIAPGAPFPLPAGHYYGDVNGPVESHGGFHDNEKPVVAAIQLRVIELGHVPGITAGTPQAAAWADGRFEAPTTEAVKRLQKAAGLVEDGRVGPVAWSALFPATTTPPPPPPSPTGHTLMVDVSNHDRTRKGGPLDWAAIRAAGVEAMTAKACEGDPQGAGWYDDPWWTEHQQGAAAAGITLRGGYHVLVAGDDDSIARQVDALRSRLDAAGCTFGVCDVEPFDYLLRAAIAPRWEDVRRFHDRWYAVDERVLAWYIPQWVWSRSPAEGGLGSHPLTGLRGPLIASHYPPVKGTAPREFYALAGGNEGAGWAPYGGVTPALWQFGSDAVIPGGSDRTDINAFRGPLAELAAVLAPAPAAPTDPPPVPPSVDVDAFAAALAPRFAEMVRDAVAEVIKLLPQPGPLVLEATLTGKVKGTAVPKTRAE